MELPLITAIIPTYKRPHMLKRAIQSVLGQTYKHFTLLIADNASGKETEEVIERFMQQDSRIKLLRHSTNIGAIANFNTALMQASTPYVCFLPDDDFFAPFFFEEALEPFNKHPDIAFCGGGGVLINQKYEVTRVDQNQQSIPPPGYYSPPKGLFAYLRSSFGIAFPPLLFKTALLKEMGGFDLRIRNGADEYLVSQCAAKYPIFLLTDRIFYFGFQHSNSLSAQIDFPLFEYETSCLYEHLRNIPFSSEEKEEIDQFFSKRQLKILSNAYRHFISLKEFEKAESYAEKIYQQTHSLSWKRKRRLAAICQHLPALSSLYTRVKKTEKTLRCFIKNPEKENSPPSLEPPDLSWKEYALSLERTDFA